MVLSQEIWLWANPESDIVWEHYICFVVIFEDFELKELEISEIKVFF